MTTFDAMHKITAEHLSRKAIIYLRQSTLKQVRHNQESQRLQYALVDKAKSLGFKDVITIDSDLGVSAAMASGPRQGFKDVLSSVALGEVGIVMSRELSRLSRTDKDWCHLLEVCQLFNTLIGDAEQVYDLNGLDDQLILGIKGTMSVAELKILKMRMHQGKEAKAKRGELFGMVAPGFVKEGSHQITQDPNRRVQDAIKLIFDKFLELASIRQTYCWFIDNKISLPVNKSDGGTYQLVWKLPSPSFIANVLHNPLYAGAYVYGRRPVKVKLVDGEPVKSQDRFLPLDQAKVFLKDTHQGYISWNTYERIQRMIENNGSNFKTDDAVIAVRKGQGLLTGLLRCQRCGRKLQIRYYGRAGTSGRYLCPGEYQQGGGYCIGFGSVGVDRHISEHLLSALSPLGISASIVALERVDNTHNDQQRALKRERQQLENETQRAFNQYDQVDPNNRLVADVLEARWNQKLEQLQTLKDRVSNDKTLNNISEKDKQKIAFLGEYFEKVWHDPTCPMELKKKIARALIEEIIVDIHEQDQQLSLIIHWQGGCHTSISIDKPLSAAKAHKTQTKDIDLIDKMVHYKDSQIAQVLCRLGRKTGKGNPWNKNRVASIRKKHRISYKPQDAKILSLRQAMQHCNVSDNTIKRLIEAKIISANQVAPYAPLEISLEDLNSQRVLDILKTLKKTGKLCLEGYTLENQKGLFDEYQ